MIFEIRKVSVIDKPENILEIRNMKNYNEEKFTEELLKQPWKHVHFCAEDPSAMWEIWKKLFLDVLDKYPPFQHKKIRSIKAPWIKNDIKTLIITRDRFKRKAILTNHESDWLNFKTTKNEVNIKKCQKRLIFLENSWSKINPKKAWKSFNSLLGRCIFGQHLKIYK